MIFDVIKQRWLRKEYRNLESRARDHQQSWPESLVIVFNADQFTDLIVFEQWCQKLDISINRLVLLGYTKDIKKNNLKDVILYDSNTIKWTGGLKNVELVTLLEKKYDLQINCFNKPSDITKYISMKLNSRLKVGYASHEESSYDLAVNVPLTKHDLFISEIAKYLKIFNP